MTREIVEEQEEQHPLLRRLYKKKISNHCYCSCDVRWEALTADCSRAWECSRAFLRKSVTLVDVGSGDEDVEVVVIADEVTGFGRQHAQKGNAANKKENNIK